MSEAIKQVPIEFKIIGYRLKVVEVPANTEPLEELEEGFEIPVDWESIHYHVEDEHWTRGNDPEEAKLYTTPEEAAAEITRLLALPNQIDKDKDLSPGEAWAIPAQVIVDIFRLSPSEDLRAVWQVEPVLEIKPVAAVDYVYRMQKCDYDGNLLREKEE